MMTFFTMVVFTMAFSEAHLLYIHRKYKFNICREVFDFTTKKASHTQTSLSDRPPLPPPPTTSCGAPVHAAPIHSSAVRTLKKKPRSSEQKNTNMEQQNTLKSPRRIEDKAAFEFGGMKKDSSTDTGAHFSRSATYSSRQLFIFKA